MAERSFRHACALVAILSQTMAPHAHATHAISYRWQSPHVTMTYQDVVGTPVPRSYGFWADMQDLGHKVRLAEGLMRSLDRGFLGDRLDVEVSIYGTGGAAPSMVLTGRDSKAVVRPPFSDGRFTFAIRRMAETRDPVIPDRLTSDQLKVAQDLLSRFPNDGFSVLAPDGRHIAFLSWRGRCVDVYVAELDSMRTKRLGATRAIGKLPSVAYTHGVLQLPVWSPDSGMIAYIADGRAAVADVTQGFGRLLTEPGCIVTEVQWSPDGRVLAATVAAQEDDRELAQDVLLLDPTGQSSPTSLKDRLTVFRRGDFRTRLVWSDDSKTLAVAVNSNDTVREPGAGQKAVLYLVDTASLDVRSVELPGRVADAAWGVGSDALAVVVKPLEGKTLLVHVSVSDLKVKDAYAADGGISILGVGVRRISFLEDDVPMAVDVDVRKEERIPGLRVESVCLAPAFFGGYLGVMLGIVTQDEPGRRLVLLEYLEDAKEELVGLEAHLAKDWGDIILAPAGTFKPGWLKRFVEVRDVVHVAWSRRSGMVVAVSPGGASLRMLALCPGGEPRDLSAEIDPAKTKVIRRWLRVGEGGSAVQPANQVKHFGTGFGLGRTMGIVVLCAAMLFAVGMGMLIRRLRIG